MEEIYELTGFVLTGTIRENGAQVIEAQSLQREAICPRCQKSSSRVHSYYNRFPQDLPVCDKNVRLALQVRRFRCMNEDCPQSTFVEQMPVIINKSARKTNRLKNALVAIAFESGGEAGAHLANKLQIEVSPDTLLRLIRNYPTTKTDTTRVMGIDDFALRKGDTYGTILIDLEKHIPIDLLPDRTSGTLAEWLKAHPGIKIITRDRSNEYARGVSEGGPEIIQITDRWHLLHNLREALERMLNRFRERLNKLPVVGELASYDKETKAGRLRKLSLAELELREAKRQRRYELFTEAQKLHQENVSIREISKKLSISRTTVYKLVASHSFPERASNKISPSILDPFIIYLRKRFDEGCENGSQLYREIHEQGYIGTYKQVSRWVHHHRKQPAKNTPKIHILKNNAQVQNHATLLAPRQLAWLLVKDPNNLDKVEQSMLNHIRQDADVEKAYDLAQHFQKMVRERVSTELDDWIYQCLNSSIIDLVNFSTGLQRDHDCVFMALREKWSNGQTEGQVNRLKLIKRKMYGRANFDLLRQRVLFSNSP
ncbi:MAG: ISL3 family transposase [Eubacteriaceae bacterium]|nr:ISL3 family transposase [Eubacteriaceae bacterium]